MSLCVSIPYIQKSIESTPVTEMFKSAEPLCTSLLAIYVPNLFLCREVCNVYIYKKFLIINIVSV